jgi:hypothetical protein
MLPPATPILDPKINAVIADSRPNVVARRTVDHVVAPITTRTPT